MTRALIGIVVVVSLIALAAIAAVIVVTVLLTDRLDNDEKQASSSAATMSGMQAESQTCDSVQDIAIVGAGIAGSYAAWRMRDEGLSVSLYEYSNRIGGRCHTVQFPGIPDINVELGAMRFKPRDHPLLNRTVHEMGLSVVDFRLGYGSGGDTLYYLRGQHLRYDQIAANAPYDLHPDHRIDPSTLEWEIFKNFTDVDSSVEGYASSPNMLFHRSTDGIPLYAQSRKSFYAKYFTTDTEQFLKDISAWDADFDNVAAANYLAQSDPALPSDNTPNPVKTVESGFQSIPETMVSQFLEASPRNTIHRNHHLRSLAKSKDGHYILSFQPTQTVRGVTKDYMNLPRKQTCAKKVLLAIPRVALEYLEWDVLKHPDIMDLIQEGTSTGRKIPKEKREENPKEQQDTMELERQLSLAVSEQSAEVQAENKLELLDQKVAIERDLQSLENFRVQQKAIEEANNQKKALLAKTLSERKQKAKKEAYKLEHIQKELSKLDTLLTADVQVIRNKIEEASRDFMDAQRRFEKAETEYIAAKVDVHNKSELKEQLTDHLYTIIQQNEVRKAKKLADLMKELDMEDSEEDLCLPELPPLSSFQPSTVVVSPTGSTPFLIKSTSNDSHNVSEIVSKPSANKNPVAVINPSVNTPCIKNSTADTQVKDSHTLVSDKDSSDQTAIDVDMPGGICGTMQRGVDEDLNNPAEHEKT